MRDDLDEETRALPNQHLPVPLQDYLEAQNTPTSLPEVVALLEIASKLVETAAYGAAGKTRESVVIDLFEVAANLETQAKFVGGLQVS